MRPLRDLKRALRRPFRLRRLRRDPVLEVSPEEAAAQGVSVLLATWNRERFLRRGLTSLLATARHPRMEVIVWDNASTDGTAAFLAGLADPRLRTVRGPENIGMNAYREMGLVAAGPLLVHLDDDVIHFPEGWLLDLARAFLRLPRVGYLACGVVQDEWTDGGKNPDHRYLRVEHAPDLVVDYGAAGQWCTMTSREVHDRIGGYPARPGTRFYWGDRDYRDSLRRAGYRSGVLETVRVYHACGPHCNEAYEEHYRGKMALLPEEGRVPFRPRGGFWEEFERRHGTGGLSQGSACINPTRP
ncbi:MAG: glycosyltransferase family 2 protein [Planctomycetes bacterium]|nr:glycosyltransferase family 2 protein [Planctomycetota bacterium]